MDNIIHTTYIPPTIGSTSLYNNSEDLVLDRISRKGMTGERQIIGNVTPYDKELREDSPWPVNPKTELPPKDI
jgi:hypothetical protein